MSARTMAKTESYKNRIEILQGTLDMLVLRILQWGPQHGHGIGQMIRANSEELLRVEHGSLYPALHRLEEQGWIAAELRPNHLPDAMPVLRSPLEDAQNEHI